MTEESLTLECLGTVCLHADPTPVKLTAFQQALAVVVLSTGGGARDVVARRIWSDGDRDRARHRLRQLISTTRSRTGGRLLTVTRNHIAPGRSVESDALVIRDALGNRGASLEKAARALKMGRLAASLQGQISDAFDEWANGVDRAWRRDLSRRAESAWAHHAPSSEWSEARDAAEAMILLHPADPVWAARLIEARGRLGQDGAAEAAFADHVAAVGKKAVREDVVAAIETIRTLPGGVDGGGAGRKPTFVGRGRELSALRGILKKVESSHPQFALVRGEAGIGKTRLLEQVRREAHLDGFRCLAAEAVEFERVIPLNPIVDALSSVDIESLTSDLGEPWRTVIGQMFPPGSLGGPVAALPLIGENALARRLFDAFALLLERIAAEGPTLFFVDDLHWCDRTTVDLLRFVQRRSGRLPLGIIATVRPDSVGRHDPCHAMLTGQASEVSLSITLGELSNREALDLLGDILDGRCNQEVSEALLEVAGPHPLYLVELARDHVRDRPSRGTGTPHVGIPVSLREILRARVDRVSERSRDILALLAVRAGAMRLSDLAVLSMQAIDEIVSVAEELGGVGLISVERDRVGIVHDLFRAAVYAEISAPRRAVLHARVAEFLEQSEDSSPGEIAPHYDLAGMPAEAARLAWIAGERCFKRGAVAEAAVFYEMVARNESAPDRVALSTAKQGVALHLDRDVLRAGPVLELASSRLRGAALTREARRVDVRRVEALSEHGHARPEEILELLTAVKHEARGAEDWEALATALDVELQTRHTAGDINGILGVFRECRTLLPIADSSGRAAANIALSLQVVFGDPSEGLQCAEEALRLTQTLPDQRLRALLRSMAMLQLRGRLMGVQYTKLVDEAQALAMKSGDLRARFSIESNLAIGALDAGDLDRAEVLFESSSALLGRAEMTHERFNQANNVGELWLARGHFENAREAFRLASAHMGGPTPSYAQQVVAAALALCAMELGDLAEARRQGDRVQTPTPPFYFDPHTLLLFQTRRLERQSDREKALTLLDEAIDDIVDRFPLAWLKLSKLFAERVVRWKEPTERALQRALPALAVARELSLGHRVVEFEHLIARCRT